MQNEILMMGVSLMAEMTDLSMSIVTYNNSTIIVKTVKNIIENIPAEYTYKFYIIDNNSSDNSVDLIEKIEGNIEIIKLGVNKGFGYGHNAILNVINSRYHFVINPDIFVEDEDQIRKIIEYFQHNDDIGLISPLIINTDMSIQYLCKIDPSIFDMMIRMISPKLFPKRQEKYVMKDTGYNKTVPIKYATGCFMAFRTAVFKQLNGFDDKFFMYLEDADITRRANEISKAVFYPEARVIHAWERGNHKNLKLIVVTIQSMITYFGKWGWKFK